MGRVFSAHPDVVLTKTHAKAVAENFCETCHGPGDRHAKGAEDGNADPVNTLVTFKKHSKQTPAEKNALCLSCHSNDDKRMYWAGSTHESRNIACVDCHTVMKSVSDSAQLKKVKQAEVCFQCHLQRKAQYERSGHMPYREGKMTCTDCHNPHGTQTPKLIAADSVNEKCYECHMEKRGPFLWEHMPVRESCLNCHESHGSNHDKLLKAKRPYLCQRCHAPGGHVGNVYDDPRDANSSISAPTTALGIIGTGQFMYNRSCQNCHSQIHGSNHPAGARFHR